MTLKQIKEMHENPYITIGRMQAILESTLKHLENDTPEYLIEKIKQFSTHRITKL